MTEDNTIEYILNRIDKRLDKTDEKLDHLSQAMIVIARAEQKLVNLENDRQELWKKVEELRIEYETTKNEVREYKASISMFNRLFWLAFASVGAAAATYFIS